MLLIECLSSANHVLTHFVLTIIVYGKYYPCPLLK